MFVLSPDAIKLVGRPQRLANSGRSWTRVEAETAQAQCCPERMTGGETF
jgi:hypothetical protein